MSLEEESLFSRDLDGRLVRLDNATAAQLDETVSLVIDGRVIQVKKAVPAVDAQGRPRLDDDGVVIPRPTTVFDAAEALADGVPVLDEATRNQAVDSEQRPIFRARRPEELRPRDYQSIPNPIPILCHQRHLDPVAVCRVCVVEVTQNKRGRRRTERRLLPACQLRVDASMEIKTIETSPRVRASVNTVVGLLMDDHPAPCAKESQNPGDCELEALARSLGTGPIPHSERPERKHDLSSPLIAVDHNACILCDRCVRACDVVKNNHVIGRMLKGYQTRIAFDLDAPMGFSSCVSCGECMISCPTGALTYRKTIDARTFESLDPPAERIEIEAELPDLHPEIQRALENVSPTFLAFNVGAIVRRRFSPGQTICRQGEYGSTAFFIEEGTAEILLEAPGQPREAARRGGPFAWLFRPVPKLSDWTAPLRHRPIPVDAPVMLAPERPQATLGEGDLFGEMACMNGYPRSATVRAGLEGCTVLEMQRNVLDMIRRSRSYREMMDHKFRERVVRTLLASVPLLAGLDPSIIDALSKRVHYRRCEPGEVILEQGAAAVSSRSPLSEGMFLVRSGFVKVSVERPGDLAVANYLGPGNYFGEIGLLTGLPIEALTTPGSPADPDLAELRQMVASGVRTATCTALDHVELVQLASDDFRRAFTALPQKSRETLIDDALTRLKQSRPDLSTTQSGTPEPNAALNLERRAGHEALLKDFLDQGLMGAQSVLVLDLLKCTRCDECAKACSDTHAGVSRLIREGLRFDKFLVASSCRSCHDPYCLAGCPVDAIHRRPGSNEIWIEQTCIGCGKCAENCPYGNINMHSLDPTGDADEPGRVAVPRRATTCDQCHSLPGHQPNCVVACPHDAAHRMQGPDLFRLVREATDY